jgi:hypothetical protein
LSIELRLAWCPETDRRAAYVDIPHFRVLVAEIAGARSASTGSGASESRCRGEQWGRQRRATGTAW